MRNQLGGKFMHALTPGSFAILGVTCQPVARAAFPEKPIRIVVSFSRCGSSDPAAGALGAEMPRSMGQPRMLIARPPTKHPLHSRSRPSLPLRPG